jgi:hypothetical protein
LKTEKNNLWKENQKLEENVIRMEHLKKVYEKSKLEIDALQVIIIIIIIYKFFSLAK